MVKHAERHMIRSIICRRLDSWWCIFFWKMLSSTRFQICNPYNSPLLRHGQNCSRQLFQDKTRSRATCVILWCIVSRSAENFSWGRSKYGVLNNGHTEESDVYQ